ncbi:MAG: hypothetical protein ACRCYY_05115 [Trueperaceae bacterium]
MPSKLKTLKRLIRQTGMTYFQFSTASGMDINTLNHLVSRLSNPTSDTLMWLCEAVASHSDMSVEDVFEALLSDILVP